MKATAVPQAIRARAIAVLVVAVLLFGAALACALPAPAQASTQNGGSCSLALTKCPVEGQTVTAYRIASWDSGGGMLAIDPALRDAQDETGIDVASFTKDTEADVLRQAATTLSGYAAEHADALAHYQAAVKDGTAAFGTVESGMYLVPATTFESDGVNYELSPILASVPASDENGGLVHNVTVEAKAAQSPADHPKNRVQKLWKDGSASADRPESVSVSIYNGIELYREVELNAQNDWAFEWEGAGDWSVRETNVPYGYACSIVQTASSADGGHAALYEITNSSTSPHSPNGPTGGHRSPKMGDYLPIVGLVLVAVGVGIVVAALGWRHHKEKSESRK